jgi:hypothetical protein
MSEILFGLKNKIKLPVKMFDTNNNNKKINKNSKTKLNKDVLLFIFSLENTSLILYISSF